ncbi:MULTISPECIES: DMT family transporter [Alphaproteobacteria]|uniref:Membrane protein n=2 Tax=Alphaproteobacteria TaxID=28211 RepID=A0A512HG96_9HYPH|nr:MULTISPECIES: DMT family transporter [Alphaproteobacteria]GEO84410.1 membrane protein [Ciceribacter naphthalenivorans]GLR22373.1 membrane protein [Ciceribacter naphthalenivorans]GLT05229.1 membrane protein [Sphingomonas psychrolutea]
MAVVASSPLRGILMKVASVAVFVGMQASIKLAGSGMPAGQIAFYRSAFAIVPILAYLAMRGDLRSAFQTANPLGHLKRGLIGVAAMGIGFYGLVLLPLPDAIAIGYAMPLLAVVFAAVFLGETVRAYRWTAVVVGLVGVMIISWPKLTLFGEQGFGSAAATGAVAVLVSAMLGAAAMMQVRQLVKEEKTATIVLFFSLTASLLSAVTWFFGWQVLSWQSLGLMALAGFFGGLGQILLTESYRHADVSTVAPFEYTSIILGSVIAYLLFDEVPTMTTLVGAAIVVGAGIFIIYREHQLGLERRAARKASTPQG